MKLLFLALVATLATAENPTACLTEVDPAIDYFPDKVEPLASEFWDIEYGNTYKIVTNLGVDESYLLYQCGTSPPQDQLDGRHAAVVPIPLSNVGITSTPDIAFLEQLALVNEIAVFVSDPDTISSPCFKERVDADEVLVIDGFSSGQDVPSFEVGQDPVDRAQVINTTVAFTSPSTEVPFGTAIKVTTYLEQSNEATFEWLKFYSAFFNLEALANEVVDLADERFDCIAENANVIASDGPKPKVLWAYYSSYCLGWDVGTCPNYYCEYAAACSVDMLDSDEGSILACGDNTYMTIEELVELGKDADYWFYPGPNWDTVYAENKEILDQMKSVQNQQVYDYQASGESGWFEQRFADYYE